jgi:hypothetical protein
MFSAVEPASSASPEVSWDALRDEAVSNIETLIADVDATCDDLRAYQKVLEKNRVHLAGGGRVDQTPALFDLRAVRTTLTDRLGTLERARGGARLALWRLQVAEGTTIAEIARMWGFSRQLVSRALTVRDSHRKS